MREYALGPNGKLLLIVCEMCHKYRFLAIGVRLSGVQSILGETNAISVSHYHHSHRHCRQPHEAGTLSARQTTTIAQMNLFMHFYPSMGVQIHRVSYWPLIYFPLCHLCWRCIKHTVSNATPLPQPSVEWRENEKLHFLQTQRSIDKRFHTIPHSVSSSRCTISFSPHLSLSLSPSPTHCDTATCATSALAHWHNTKLCSWTMSEKKKNKIIYKRMCTDNYITFRRWFYLILVANDRENACSTCECATNILALLLLLLLLLLCA